MQLVNDNAYKSIPVDPTDRGETLIILSRSEAWEDKPGIRSGIWHLIVDGPVVATYGNLHAHEDEGWDVGRWMENGDFVLYPSDNLVDELAVDPEEWFGGTLLFSDVEWVYAASGTFNRDYGFGG